MAVAVFKYAAWSLRFPKLVSTVPEPLADMYFAEACTFLDNSDCSLVEDVNLRLTYLNLIVAHIALCNGAGGDDRSALVGRISSVTEGSVTIAAELNGFTGDQAAYFAQTPYGAQYWASTNGYRTMQYVPGQQPFLGVPGEGLVRGYGLYGWLR